MDHPPRTPKASPGSGATSSETPSAKVLPSTVGLMFVKPSDTSALSRTGTSIGRSEFEGGGGGTGDATASTPTSARTIVGPAASGGG